MGDAPSSASASPGRMSLNSPDEALQMLQRASISQIKGSDPKNHTSSHKGCAPDVVGSLADTRDHDIDDDTEYRSADEEVTRLVLSEPTKARKVTQKKKLEQANFAKWLTTNQRNLTKKATNVPSQQAESLRYMVKSWEGGDKIIGKARDYQLELFERAKNENTIAILDTGSGKTLIAVLLLEHTINQELEDRKNGLSRRLAFFLVDKVALAFQQQAVLDCNLAHSSAVFSGESVKHSWTGGFWASELAKHEVIVCTAEILKQLLQYAYIRIDQINLLIFDEAHHTKKSHPYARIIKDFYVAGKERGLRVPRIFGMTASPVDAIIDVRQAATELEAMLHSRIATTADPDALKRSVSKPKNEVVAKYAPLGRAIDTTLTERLSRVIGNNKIFAKSFSFAKSSVRELGPWLVDRMWKLVFVSDEILKLEVKTERNFTKNMATAEVVETRKFAVQSARALVENHELPKPEDSLLSSKTRLLVQILMSHFSSRDSQIRCIVFVERRWTAKLLTDFFANYRILPGLKVGSLMGASQLDGTSETSFREQIKTIIDFKKGILNCIFATSVAEEGLDIPDCNLIIRFDLCKTMIQYIQSRGRARQAESTYIHIIEQGNGEHARNIYQNAENESLLRKFCSTQPEDRLLKGSDHDMEYFLKKEGKLLKYTIEATGAKLTYHNSMTILQDFINSLRNQEDFVEGMPLAADYSIAPFDGGFLCEITMPASAPFTNVRGRVYSTKQVAKCSAAFEACLRLIKGKFLDDNLRSKFAERRRHLLANAQLAVSSKKKTKYDLRLKPLLWAELGALEKLYATALTLAKPNALERLSRPLFLLTRSPLPTMKAFPLFFGPGEKGLSSDLVTIGLSVPIVPSKEDVQLFRRFTLKIFQDLFNKRYSVNAEEMCYFFVPTNKTHHAFSFPVSEDPRSLIDWPLLNYVWNNEAEVYTGQEPDEFFRDKYVIDPHDGSRRFWLRGVRRDLNCQDPVPDEVEIQPTYREWKRGEVAHNILNWSVTAWKATREAREKLWAENQPVAVGIYASLRRDYLADFKEDRKNRICFFALEPMRISPLGADIAAMGYLLPSTIHRIEQNLIALDACELLGLNIHPDLALEALTQDSDNQAENEDNNYLELFEPLNFQPGMGNNYERLEFLGDSFLKMATTISIFTLIPNKDEFDYHCERMLMICNQNLFNVALEAKLQEYIRSKAFERGTWYPVWKLEFGKTHLKTLKQMDDHQLADKSIADVCEALIGAAYMTTRKENDFDMAVQAVTRLVDHKRHTMKAWGDYYAAYRIPDWQAVPANAAEVDMARKIEEITGYTFKYPRILRSAFRHPSRPYVYDRVPTYQRLEFLGDALLDMACVDYLFHIAPDKGPQWLTEHKMAMVSNQFLGCLAVSLGFHKFILHNQSTIGNQILEYVTELTSARQKAEDAAEAAGKTRSEFARDYWVDASQPPKCIADVLEAYLGAIFVDSEYDYATIQRFFNKHMLPYFSEMRIYDTFANKHPVTFFTHYVFEKFGCHAYGLHAEEISVRDGDDVITGQTKVVAGILIHGHVVEGAVRESGRYAKVAAARKAMAKVQDMTKEDFVKEYSCKCKLVEEPDDIHESATPI
ncbi:Dicer-like protein 1 [Gnomoniopsis smithogilvyi]|uniref:Dicer-like protein 1 n=1 Tax=Gnomoniopsis smithogilvyi TaxID=1191159 RepID=A0A9W9CWV5_9PEZI|nr:Dicer-like protein 1 [Gnomoniopsis smithogilvyi]